MVAGTPTWINSSMLLLTVSWGFLFLFSNLSLIEARPKYCRYTCEGEKCLLPPAGCKYGETRNECGQLECLGGPGSSCNVKRCHEQLTCSCNKCTGCIFNDLLGLECHFLSGVCKDLTSTNDKYY